MAKGRFCQFFFTDATLCYSIIEWSIYKLALSMHKATVSDLFYLLEIWNKCCVVWLVRSLVSCHDVWKLPYRTVTAKKVFMCYSTFLPWIWVMTFFLILVWKLPARVCYWETPIWSSSGVCGGICESPWQAWCTDLKHTTCLSVIRRLLPVRASDTQLMILSSFWLLLWELLFFDLEFIDSFSSLTDWVLPLTKVFFPTSLPV